MAKNIHNRNWIYFREYLVLFLFICVVLSPWIIGAYSVHQSNVRNRVKSQILENVSSDGTSKIDFENEGKADSFRKTAESLNLENIKKISTQKDGENFEVVITFKRR